MSLDSIVGFEMSSVIFIRDYLQLVFEGVDRTQTLTAFSITSVSIKGMDTKTMNRDIVMLYVH